MAIVHMKKLRLMVVRRQKDELLRDLMLLGCVQISEPDALLADAESAAVLRQESGNVTEVRSELTRLTAALKLLDKYAPVKSRLLSSRPEVTEADFLDDGAYRQELDAVAQLEELEAAVRRYNGEEAKLRSNMEALRPWQTLDLPLDLGETVRTRISLGMLPAAVDLAETAKALADAAPESQLYEISSDKEQHYVLLICLKEELTEAITALRASGFTLANLNGAPGTAKQNSRVPVTFPLKALVWTQLWMSAPKALDSAHLWAMLVPNFASCTSTPQRRRAAVSASAILWHWTCSLVLPQAYLFSTWSLGLI
jgi:V/A-type H+-transporting ATPase subunit I